MKRKENIYLQMIERVFKYIEEKLNLKIGSYPKVKIINDLSKPHSFGMLKGSEIIVNLHFYDEKALVATVSHEFLHFIFRKLNIKIDKCIEEVLCTLIHTILFYDFFREEIVISENEDKCYKIGKILGKYLSKLDNRWEIVKDIIDSLIEI